MDEDQVRPEAERPGGARPLAAPLRSRAALGAGRRRGSQRSIAIALLSNVVIAFAKLAAGLITGSSALLAEAAHSTADSTNEVLLGLSLRRARRPADARHPFGYGGTRFLWCSCRDRPEWRRLWAGGVGGVRSRHERRKHRRPDRAARGGRARPT